ncbi:MAG: nucleotide exchange factor GrpE [Patescibacteria group bacterium]
MNDEDKNKNENEDLRVVEDDFEPEAAEKLKKIKNELKECRKKAAEFLAGWQRAKADLINARKDEEKNREAMAKYANERMAREILNVLDSLDQAVAEPSLEEKWKTGFQYIRNQLMQIIRGYGVGVIESVGQKFSPEEHESVAEEDAPEAEQDQIVLQELQKGYRMHDKVLRPAKVKIGIYKNKN